MTLKIEEDAFLPDVMVTCDKEDLNFAENPTYIERPQLVIEVLSPSTEKDDRGDKFLKYTYCPTIQEYVLVNYDCMLIQTYTRKDLQWIYTGFMQDQGVELPSIGLTIPVHAIYNRIILPPFDPFRRYRKRNIPTT